MLTTPIAWDISGCVHIISYIKLPTTGEYGKNEISSFYFSVDGWSLLLNLKWPASGVETSFEFFILNLSSIHSIYLSCDNHNFPAFLSRRISIPKIRFTLPKSSCQTSLTIPFLASGLYRHPDPQSTYHQHITRV